MIENNDPRWKPVVYDSGKAPDNVGVRVLGLLEHFNEKFESEIVEIRAVDESDCNFRTADGDDEISYNWTVTHWMPVPDDWEEKKASLAEEKIKDIEEHPEAHKHTYGDLHSCCTIAGAVDLSIMEAHRKHVDLGTNGGVRCDVTEGPCACGGWHE